MYFSKYLCAWIVIYSSILCKSRETKMKKRQQWGGEVAACCCFVVVGG